MRLKPKRHLFRYSVFSLFLDIDKLVEFDKTSWFFRLNRWGMVSLYEKDHGDRSTLRLRDWVNKKLRTEELDRLFLGLMLFIIYWQIMTF